MYSFQTCRRKSDLLKSKYKNRKHAKYKTYKVAKVNKITDKTMRIYQQLEIFTCISLRNSRDLPQANINLKYTFTFNTLFNLPQFPTLCFHIAVFLCNNTGVSFSFPLSYQQLLS